MWIGRPVSEWLDSSSLSNVIPGFWSITVYTSQGERPISWNSTLPSIYQPGLELSTDTNGDAQVILSKEPLPISLGFNWLPLPTKDSPEFYMIMRVYAPQSDMVGDPDDPPAYPWSALVVTRIGRQRPFLVTGGCHSSLDPIWSRERSPTAFQAESGNAALRPPDALLLRSLALGVE